MGLKSIYSFSWTLQDYLYPSPLTWLHGFRPKLCSPFPAEWKVSASIIYIPWCTYYILNKMGFHDHLHYTLQFWMPPGSPNSHYCLWHQRILNFFQSIASESGVCWPRILLRIARHAIKKLHSKYSAVEQNPCIHTTL